MVLSFAILGLWACTPPDLPPPTVSGVTPAFAYNGNDHSVTILGEGFWPQIAIDAWQGGADVDKSYSAWLQGPADGLDLRHPFSGVGMVDDRHLSATVEAGLPPGTYDLAVESPTGQRASLAAAFTVTDTEAASLRLESSSGVYPFTDPAELTIELVDLAGDRVPIRFEVALVATIDGSTEVPLYDAGTLGDAHPTPDADGIVGFVEDGAATLSITAPIPGEMTVRVSPWGEEASPILDDTLSLTFVPGDDLEVALRLPVPTIPRPVFEAGSIVMVEAELVDHYGNPVSANTSVFLATTCSNWIAPIELDGPTPVQVEPRRITDANCPDDRVYVLQGPPGESAPYTVIAGAADHFGVFASQSVRAGDPLQLVVVPADKYDNATAWSGSLSVSPTIGVYANPVCSDEIVWWSCTGVLTHAGDQITAEVNGDDGISGRSNAFSVLPGELAASIAVTVDGPAVAGVAVPVEVRPLDPWGNAIDASGLGIAPFTLTDPLGEVDCTATGYLIDGAATFDCVLTTARPDATITADLPSHGAVGTSAPFAVDNGPLAIVTFTVTPTVVAGSLTAVNLAGFDAYGNNYLLMGDPVVSLSDDSDTFSAASATFGLAGTASVSGFFTRAGTTTIHASQGGVELGASPAIQVLAAGTDGFAITALAPWAWVGEPVDVQVEAVDVFGNRTDWTGTATLSSSRTASPVVDVPLVNGVGIDSFTWSATSFVDLLEATSGSFTGEEELPVASRCAGPSAVMTFGGETDAIACQDPLTGSSTVTADLSGSLAGARAIIGYAVAEVGGERVTDNTSVLDLTVPGIGRHSLRGLVVDSSGCGSEVDATGWTGPDDGTPVGPIALTSTVDELSVVDSATIDLADVVDCSRDPAAGQSVELRATGGTLAATATGSGLVVTLDALGGTSVALATAGGLAGGTGGAIEVHATVASGAASGRLAVALIDDNVLPIVVSQDPAGVWFDPVSVVTLGFSEPLLASSVIPANFAITGPEPISVATATLDPGGTTVTLGLTPSATASLGGFGVSVTRLVRDVAGNRLSGDWSGIAADYLGGFGDEGVAPGDAGCASFDPPGLAIRPDGDPGSGAESDALAVLVSSAVAPAWWVLEVTDGAGARVFTDWEVPIGPVDTVSWDARDLQGLIVPNGAYRVSVAPDDGLGNRGLGCEVTVTVDNPVGTAE
ncbi:MAG: Ig-like domain-containing protein [Myxococcota bacterium]